MRHDVAPVTRGIADREKDRLVLPARLRERFFAPRIPIDRIVCVLKKVWRLLVREPVCVSERACVCSTTFSPDVTNHVSARNPKRKRVVIVFDQILDHLMLLPLRAQPAEVSKAEAEGRRHCLESRPLNPSEGMGADFCKVADQPGDRVHPDELLRESN